MSIRGQLDELAAALRQLDESRMERERLERAAKVARVKRICGGWSFADESLLEEFEARVADEIDDTQIPPWVCLGVDMLADRMGLVKMPDGFAKDDGNPFGKFMDGLTIGETDDGEDEAGMQDDAQGDRGRSEAL